MANLVKKFKDEDIIRLNSVGLSLKEIAAQLGCHHTTVTMRLTELGIAPADTRRSFMNRIFNSLSEQQQEWLILQLEGGRPIEDFIKSLLVQKYMASK